MTKQEVVYSGDVLRFGSVRFGWVRLGSVRFGSVRFGCVRLCFGSDVCLCLWKAWIVLSIGQSTRTVQGKTHVDGKATHDVAAEVVRYVAGE